MNKQFNKRIFQTKENLHKRFLKDNLRQLIIRTSIRTIKNFLETQGKIKPKQKYQNNSTDN